MVLASSHSIDLKLTLLHGMPDFLKDLLNKVSQQHYDELYEPEADGRTSLQDSLSEVLEAFQNSSYNLCHLRYVWMALIMTVLVEPTWEYYQPRNSFSKNIINLMTFWLLDTIKKLTTLKENGTKIDIGDLLDMLTNEQELSYKKEIVNYQIINEANRVFYNAIRVIDYDQSMEAILEILDDCLEGYAVFPGSYGRRELLDWWILDVVPASWFLLPPKSLYVVEGIGDKEKIQLRQNSLLKRISYAMWFFFQEGLGSQVEAKFQPPYSMYNNNFIKKVEMGFEIQSDKFNSNHSISNFQARNRVVLTV